MKFLEGWDVRLDLCQCDVIWIAIGIQEFLKGIFTIPG